MTMKGTKHSRRIVSVCLMTSAVALTAWLAATPAQAGFEWTPLAAAPAAAPAPVVSAPMSSSPMSSSMPTPALSTMSDQVPAAPMPPVTAAPLMPADASAPVMNNAANNNVTNDTVMAPPLVLSPASAAPDMPAVSMAPSMDVVPVVVAPQPVHRPMASFFMKANNAPVAIEPEPAPVMMDAPPMVSDTGVGLPPPAVMAPATVAPPAHYNAAPLMGDVVQGFGHDIPLAVVLHQVVPPGYAASFGPGVNPGERLSWRGGRVWEAVLQEALAPAHLMAVINENELRVVRTDYVPAFVRVPQYSPEQLAIIGKHAANFPINYPRHHPAHEKTSPPSERMTAMTAKPTTSAIDDYSTEPSSAEIKKSAENDTILDRTPVVVRTDGPHYAYADAPHYADSIRVDNVREYGLDGNAPPDLGPSAPPPPSPEVSHNALDLTHGDVDHRDASQQPLPLSDQVRPVAPETVPEMAHDTAPDMAAPDMAPNMAADAPAPLAAPMAAPSPVTSSAIQGVTSWNAGKGDSLHETLAAWCQQAGVSLVWESHKDYHLPRRMNVNGTFAEAVSRLLTAYNDKHPRPVGTLHPNLPDGPAVLIVANPNTLS